MLSKLSVPIFYDIVTLYPQEVNSMSVTPYTSARKRADKKYTSNTDQLRVRIPKGKKAEFISHAENMNETIGQFVIRALDTVKDEDSRSIQRNGQDASIETGVPLIPQFEYTNGKIYNTDCIPFLENLQEGSIPMIFADPPYNIGKAEWDDIGDQDEYIAWSLNWIKAASRVLTDNGTLYICGFTEILADLRRPAMDYFEKCHWLIWHYDNKANMRDDWGRSHESILCLRKSGRFIFNTDDVREPYNAHTRKYPDRAQSGKTSQFYNEKTAGSTWTPNPKGRKPKDVINIPTTCNGMSEKTAHPTQKPEELVRKMVLASSNTGDTVVDPFSGSGTTAVVCTQLGRNFLVNDQNAEYNAWADERIRAVNNFDVASWIKRDNDNDIRRRSIR